MLLFLINIWWAIVLKTFCKKWLDFLHYNTVLEWIQETWRYTIPYFLIFASENVEQLAGKFGDAVATLDQSKLVQISSDGPNVGCSFWTYRTLPLNSKVGSEHSPMESEVMRFAIFFDPKYMVNMQVSFS